MSKTTMYGRTALTGGTKSVDNIPYASLIDGVLCTVTTSSKVPSLYRFESSSAAAESSPVIIEPDDQTGNGRWELVSSPTASFPDYTETDQGVAGNGFTINTFVDAIGADNATIKLRHNSGSDKTTYTLTTSETIPSNVALEIENGAILDGAGTLTQNGPFNPGSFQVFGSSITVVFGASSIKEI